MQPLARVGPRTRASCKRAHDHVPQELPPPRTKDRGCAFTGLGRWCASCPACTPAARGAPAGRGPRAAGPRPRAGAPRAAAGGAAHQAARAAHDIQRELRARVDWLRRGRGPKVARLQVQGQVVLLRLGQPERQGPACAPAHTACCDGHAAAVAAWRGHLGRCMVAHCTASMTCHGARPDEAVEGLRRGPERVPEKLQAASTPAPSAEPEM